jgi:hypothetical protein
MTAHTFATAARRAHHPVVLIASEPETPWEAKGFGDLVPPASLAEARVYRDDLARLLAREHQAAADFLLALADFDRRRGWERLGHASLFTFLTRELGLSNGAAWHRQSAARLLPRFPAVERALRAGQLCLTVVGDLARVLTPENEAEVLPRFIGTSSREAKEVVAAILPCPEPPRRDVVTAIRGPVPVSAAEQTPLPETTSVTEAAALPLRAHEVTPTQPARGIRDAVVPLTAELRRLSMTVSARFLRKLDAARDGLSHAVPGATAEQVLEAALDLLLEQQAMRRGQAKRPRPDRNPPVAPAAEPPAPTGPSDRYVPAKVRREVWARDEGRCQHPLDSGGICGSTVRVELDHVQPVVLGGPPVAANLRLACSVHNQRAARETLSDVVMSVTRGKRRRR